ncbi:MAG: hypothetical protein P1U70_21040 [Saprospiraceae bacterium]|jgi:hypothetical protein|nr:hypothetical protein [Saprospiraceae bacterium]
MIEFLQQINIKLFFCNSERSVESGVLTLLSRFFPTFRGIKVAPYLNMDIKRKRVRFSKFLRFGKPLFAILIFLFALPTQIFSQTENLSNLRQKVIELTQKSQKLDSLTIISESVILINQGTKDTLPKEAFQIKNNELQIRDSIITPNSSFLVQYRILPYDLSVRRTHFDSTKIKKQGDRIIGITFDPYEEEESILEFQKGLDYSGSFARGISVGNSQNLVLNSNFNLQMSGSLGDGMEVLAAITDNNIPLQPEGNTQQLSEFDKIFIQITKNENKLIAGDYELSRPPGYFMNYFKKLQGGTFSRQWDVGKGKSGARSRALPKGILNSQASIAVARGKFARNNIIALEGNQGPYRLEGAENERFIIILAGTEKVWIDGVVMKRGIEADYIIDYNAGHVTFMQKQLITKDSRIIVEFEYADQNYLRSMYAVNLDYQQGDKFRMHFNVFSQQDGKQPVEEEFSSAEFSALENAGDNPLNSVVSSIAAIDEFSAFRVLYEVRDSMGFDSVLVFSTDEEAQLFSAFFSFVGAGNGDYVIDPTIAANGRVYRWVAPQIIGDSIVHFGEYAPIRQLVSPKQQQLFTLGAEYQLSKKSKITAEVGLSNNDLNRLSRLDEDDNLGLALFTEIENDFELGAKKEWKLETDFSYEFVGDRFQPLNPYRNAEFSRDWNIQSNEKVDEHIGRGGFQLKNKTKGNLSYLFSGFLRDSIYEGSKHFVRYNWNQKGYEILLEGNLLNGDGLEEKSQFFRPKINIGIPLFRDSTGRKYWKIGTYGERERNERFLKKNAQISDTLSLNSFWYDLYRIYLKSPESQIINFSVKYQNRKDYAPLNTDFEQSTNADELSITGNWNPRWRSGKKERRNNMRLGWNFTYRQLEIKDETLTNQEPAETFLGKLNYGLNLVNGVFQTNTNYEIGSGQERKSEFVFIPVQPGEGNFVWRNDDNLDGIIQQNEVEIAPFQDSANVLRQVIFTNEFIRTNNILFNQSLRVEPRAIWYTEKGLKKLISRFSTSSSLQITRKVKDAPGVSLWNPFQLDIIDTSLVATRSGVRNVLIFNPNNPKFSIEVGHSDNQDKVVLTTGFESRRREEQFLKTRWNVTKTISTKMEFSTGRKIQDSEQFDNKDYNIQFFNLKPEVTWLPLKTFRTILNYKYEDAKNTLDGTDEFATQHEMELEMRYNQPSKISISSGFSFIKIDFNGEANSPVGFAFLNGLQNGNNFLWNLTLDRQLARNMRVSLSYEGRKTGTGRVVHVGRASVAATF